jgi:membrane protein DedA with SNARE-associated domain
MEWLQAVVEWTQAHPRLMLAACFLIAFTECTVFVGLVLPGAWLLFFIGAMVSLGALPFGTTIALMIAGALTGDLLSYELGRRYGHALFRLRFMQRYPGLMERGAAFFRRHGGKGIAVAHLWGGSRPLLPAVAGAYGFSRLRFLLAIIPGAALWTVVYVLPGVAFGASLGLAAEVTKRLAIVLLVVAVTVWIAWWTTQRLVVLLGRNAERWLNAITDWSHHHGPLGRIGAFADPRSLELPALASLGLLLIVSGAALIAILWTAGGQPPTIDLLAHDALQNLHEPWGVRLAALAVLCGEPVVYGSFAATLLVLMLLQRRWDMFRHLVALLAFGGLWYLALSFAPGLRPPPEASRLALHQDLILPISIYGLVPVLFGGGATINRRIAWFALVSAALLLLVLARLYLGGTWLSLAITTSLIGLVWTAGVGFSFRRHGAPALQISALAPALAALVIAMVAAGSDGFRTRVRAALPDRALHSISQDSWWEHGWATLPQRRVDLAGRDKQFLNLQWAGQLPVIRRVLESQGWTLYSRLTFATGLRWLTATGPIDQLPLMPRMHEGRYASLTMRQPIAEDDRQLTIRLWPSGYVLDQRHPLWIGTITSQRAGEFFRLLRYPVNEDRYTASLAKLQTPGFESRDAHRAPGSLTVRLLRPQTTP